MTLGFSRSFGHAFDSVWANDLDDDCVETYNANFGEHCLSGDIVDILNGPTVNIPEAVTLFQAQWGTPHDAPHHLDGMASVRRKRLLYPLHI